MKILIAEDDPLSSLLMQRTLEKFGYEVVLAEDGHAAIEILSQPDGPRLALIDWMMPKLDGLELCREVRSAQREGAYIYILLLTSRQDAEDVVAGLEAGADDYITKPFHPAVLRARLHTGRRILSLEETLVQAREEMRFKATHDALTSLWNRGSILSVARNELRRCERETRPFSVLLCDIDHFKQVNDNYGHLAGDIVLEEVGRRLVSSVRDYDAVGRYGGEEFLIVLSNCDENSLRARAENIRSAIASMSIQAANAELSVTISIGAITYSSSQPDVPLESILAQADAALYCAKAEGRDRAIFAAPLIEA
ncbi:GGDEF domain-containing protein [Acidicapsa dinghuensis]|uniref:diguanylate cyclase n=1 Tax=Acidicapsa dinghuensis TaxID=2218256 RepID=A0ABW1EG16_9BACT|nr:diguanylate cyclase [Acidicapsa dinghuensis]